MFRPFYNGSRGPTLLSAVGGEAELVRGCMTTTRKAKELTESLGLCNTNTGSPKLKFNDPDVIELNKEVQAAVDSFLHPPNQPSADLKEALGRKETFNSVVEAIFQRYGQKIWGKTKRNHLLVAGAKPLYPKDLFWDSKEDQRAIKIYLRCWMIKRAARSIGDRERRSKNQKIYPPPNGDKPKTPTRKESFDSSDAESSSEEGEIIEYVDSPPRTENPSFVPVSPILPVFPTTTISNIPTTFRTRMAEGFYRSGPTTVSAPIARMYSTPPSSQMLLPPIQIPKSKQSSHLFEPETSDSLVTAVQETDAVYAGEGNEREENNDDLYEDPSPRAQPSSLTTPISPPVPNKRKRIENSQSSQEAPPTKGKLHKVNTSWRRSLAEMPKQRKSDDTYAVPESPSQSTSMTDPGPERVGRRFRVGSIESDPSYIPSRASSKEQEDDIDYMISEHLGPLFGSSQIDETATQEIHLLSTQNKLARCSGSGEADIEVHDSVTYVPTKKPYQGNGKFVETAENGYCTDEEDEEDDDAPLLPTRSSESCFTVKTPPSPPPLISHQETLLRRELFILLLSFLNSINQFAPLSSIYHAAEDRLDQLLYHFVETDTPTLLSAHPDRSRGLLNAFTAWMALRTRLRIFHAKTHYSGSPGEEWRAWLRARDDTGERAQACIALVEMCEGGFGVASTMGRYGTENTEGDREKLNTQLKDLFDLLTMFPACNGAEEFEGISRWNERLWVWFT